MTDVSRLSTLRYALQSSAVDFTSIPGTLVPLRPTDDGASFLPRMRSMIARNLRSLSGRRYLSARGAQDVADITLATEFKGVNSNTGGAVSDWEAKMEQGYLLASLFGAVGVATTGAAPTVAASGHSPSTGVLVVVGTTLANGNVIAFTTSETDPQGNQVIEIGRIASGGGTTTVTLEHPYTGTPATGTTVIRGAVYTVSDTVTHHVHTFFAAEGENWRRNYLGCAPMSMALSVPNTGIVGMTSVFSPTSFTDAGENNPTHAEPTAGSPVVVDGARVWFGGTSILARDISISYSCATTTRTAATRANGRLGGVQGTGDGKTFTIEFSFYLGDASIPGELPDDGGTFDLGDIIGDDQQAGDIVTARKLSLQVGTEVGASFYAYLPEADCNVTTQHVDGLTMVKVVATGTGAVPAVFAVL
jgi:hypothetical protein